MPILIRSPTGLRRLSTCPGDYHRGIEQEQHNKRSQNIQHTESHILALGNETGYPAASSQVAKPCHWACL